jgi:sigma-B regulation protein RsbU (phosphoserine phosphatase)
MELGRQIQADFMPARLPYTPGWEIASRFLPAGEVSGDFFDVFQPFDDHLILAIGDVSGKGVGAALFMALIRTLLRAFSEYGDGSSDDVLNAVHLVNRYILRHHQQHTNMFVTLFLGVLELRTGELRYINAGHVPPVLSHADGSQELLFPSGPIIGVIENLSFEKRTTRLDQGDLLLLYTDGVTEATDMDHRLFGIERLQGLLHCNDCAPSELLRSIETHLIAYSGKSPFSDDVTMLAIKRL